MPDATVIEKVPPAVTPVEAAKPASNNLADLLAEFNTPDQPKLDADAKVKNLAEKAEKASEEDQAFQHLTKDFTQEKAEIIAQDRVGQLEGFSDSVAQNHGYKLEKPTSPEYQQAEAQALNELNLTRAPQAFSADHNRLTAKIEELIEKVKQVEVPRVRDLTLTHTLLEHSHMHLAEELKSTQLLQKLQEAGDLSGRQVFGSGGWIREAQASPADLFNRLSEEKKREVIDMRRKHARTKLEQLGIKALEKDHIAALPILAAAGKLEDVDVIATLQNRLHNMSPDKQGDFLKALSFYQQARQSGAEIALSFLDKDEYHPSIRTVTITPDGERKIDVGTVYPHSILKNTAGQLVIEMFREQNAAIAPKS